MKDAILIQSWFTPEHKQMLELTRQRHERYAKQQGMDYLPNDMTGERMTFGQKCYRDIAIIQDALDRGYTYVISADLDVIIWDMSRDLHQACIDIRGVRFDAMRVKHVNIGLIYVRNCDLTRRFLVQWEALARGKQGTYGPQNAFNVISKRMGIPALDPTWNYCYSQHKGIDMPAVRGYHDFIGFTHKMNAMREDLDALYEGVRLSHEYRKGLYQWVQ